MVWFIGDEFTCRNIDPYLHHVTDGDKKLYTMEMFEVKDYATMKYKSSLRNVLARFLSLIKLGITENNYLPKAIFLVQMMTS